MLRIIVAAVKAVGANTGRITSNHLSGISQLNTPVYIRQHCCKFSQLYTPRLSTPILLDSVAQPSCPVILQPQTRTLTKFSLKKGKRKSVKAVIRRFFRLHWGGWIRTRAGRRKHLWRKTPKARYLYRQHVFCNVTQSWLLDKMVTNYWRKPKYYVDDPYEPYHTREEYLYSRRKPHAS